MDAKNAKKPRHGVAFSYFRSAFAAFPGFVASGFLRIFFPKTLSRQIDKKMKL